MGATDLHDLPPVPAVSAADVAAAVERSGRILVVLDDDPTGTMSVSALPVLTRWEVDDFRWAFAPKGDGPRAAAVYVLTNTRSLDPTEAEDRNRQVVVAALAAADEAGIPVGFVSRSDSTLRGHFPLETDVIADTVAAHGRPPIDGVVLVPAFPDAGRVTIAGEHYLTVDGRLVPVAETEFARDATFGFSSSFLPAYVEEKSAGRIRQDDVVSLGLDVVRSGTEGIAAVVLAARDAVPIVADAVVEEDLRALALGLELAEEQGAALLYRVGPPFVRARIGQNARAPLTAGEIFPAGHAPTGASGGLIVVGSHVALTTRQLARLTDAHTGARIVEIDVHRLLDPAGATEHVDDIVAKVVAAIADDDVILHTSRLLVRTADAVDSLRIARTVSAGVVAVVNRTLKTLPPRFVIAKGGITSSDVAAHGLEIRRAIVRGPMLPGIVSLWEAVDGPAAGIPYVVFAGNVGDDESLLQVTRTLSAHLDEQEATRIGDR